MSLATNLSDLATRIATECKSLRTIANGNAADLSSLQTTAKSNLVAAVNELHAEIGTLIADGSPGVASTWSSDKINDELIALKADILDGASSAYDTLQELATLIQDNDTDISTVLTGLGTRLRFDASQTLSSDEKAQARSNIDAAPTVHVHTAASGSVDGFMAAADKTKLDGVEAGANNYSHPTADGSRHVPATGTGNNGKFLKSGATAGSEAWVQPVKGDVGLGNVDNTSDANKPVSTAQQTALNLKANAANAALTGTTGAEAAEIGTTVASPMKVKRTSGAEQVAMEFDIPTGTSVFVGNDAGVLKAGASSNLAVSGVKIMTQTDTGDPDTNFVTTFEAGLV